MARKLDFSAKKLALDKANTQTVLIVAVASFVTIFSLITASGFFTQNKYKAKVIDAKAIANDQLEDNITEAKKLEASYNDFASSPTNVIGGSKSSNDDKGGDNARIVLDALPSKYDFPALTSSIEKLLEQYKVVSVTGIDDEVAQQATESAPDPVAVVMPFTFTVEGTSFESARALITKLQKSIRPIQIDTLTLNSGTDGIQVIVNAHTYYQPEKNLKITKEVVRAK